MTFNEIVPELTNGEFENFAKEGFVFLDFFAEWNMPCTMMVPIIDEISETFRGKIKFGKVNIDDNQRIAEKFEVSKLPTFVLMKDSQILEKMSGEFNEDEIMEILNRYL